MQEDRKEGGIPEEKRDGVRTTSDKNDRVGTFSEKKYDRARTFPENKNKLAETISDQKCPGRVPFNSTPSLKKERKTSTSSRSDKTRKITR